MSERKRERAREGDRAGASMRSLALQQRNACVRARSPAIPPSTDLNSAAAAAGAAAALSVALDSMTAAAGRNEQVAATDLSEGRADWSVKA